MVLRWTTWNFIIFTCQWFSTYKPLPSIFFIYIQQSTIMKKFFVHLPSIFCIDMYTYTCVLYFCSICNSIILQVLLLLSLFITSIYLQKIMTISHIQRCVVEYSSILPKTMKRSNCSCFFFAAASVYRLWRNFFFCVCLQHGQIFFFLSRTGKKWWKRMEGIWIFRLWEQCFNLNLNWRQKIIKKIFALYIFCGLTRVWVGALWLTKIFWYLGFLSFFGFILIIMLTCFKFAFSFLKNEFQRFFHLDSLKSSPRSLASN